MEVVRLKANDIDSYKYFIKEVFGYDVNRRNITSSMKNNIILVIKLDEKIISSITIEEKKDYIKNKKYYLATYFGVLKEYRRMGFATKLFDYVEEMIKKNNIDYIELNSGNQRKEAYNFYSKNKFRVKDTTTFVKFYN